jgi:hypothetical protein
MRSAGADVASCSAAARGRIAANTVRPSATFCASPASASTEAGSSRQAPSVARTSRPSSARVSRADQAAERLVGEGQVDADAVGSHVTPAVRQVPEQGDEPVLDAGQLRDRLMRGRPPDLLGRHLHEAARQPRPAPRRDQEAVVEQRHLGRHRHVMPELDRERGRCQLVVADEISGPVEMRAHTAGEEDFADAEPRDQDRAEEPAADAGVRGEVGRRPLAGAELDERADDLIAHRAEGVGIEVSPEARFHVEQAHGTGGRLGDHQLPKSMFVA